MATFGRVFPAVVDLKGTELILDADADTTITADTDDQIDIKIAGADDFQFTANTFTALSGSTVAIASGATIANSGTATGFGGADAERAMAGVLETNANFVDQVIFGPSVDGVPWNGAWSKASVFSSLMLATIEDEGSNTEINIWDLTEQTSGAISTTPLATIDLANAATPTSIAACMGYLIVSSEDGIAIIDPHSGAWAERTQGWPRTLSSSTTPALTNNDVQAVAAGFSDQPAFDPRTGGPMPTFVLQYGTGADIAALLKDDGNLYNRAGTVGNTGVAIWNGRPVTSDNVTANDTRAHNPISTINADDWTASTNIITTNNYPAGFAADNGISVAANKLANASDSGLNILFGVRAGEVAAGGDGSQISIAKITRTVNSGFMNGDVRGAWLANSKTADLSAYNNTLTEEGTVTEAVVASGTELKGYSGFSSSVTLVRASDADWDVITTGSAYLSIWFKCSGNSGFEHYIGFNKADGAIEFELGLLAAGTVRGKDDGATAQTTVTSGAAFDDNAWHKADFVRVSSTERYLYVDGVLVSSDTTDAGSLSDDGNLPLGIGCNGDATNNPAATSTLSLARLSATAPTATQVRQMYDAEKGMFVANAECLLQSGSTDAVLDVDVDPLSGKVLVTQTDAITVFDGLVVDSKPTVNSGASEKGKLWGDLRAEQNSANAYVTAPAVDQRQVNEMVRGLASELPKGVDLSKAKAWLVYDQGTPAIQASYNIKSVTDNSTGNFTVNFAIPFKGSEPSNGSTYSIIGMSGRNGDGALNYAGQAVKNDQCTFVSFRPHAEAVIDTYVSVAFFGELDNE